MEEIKLNVVIVDDEPKAILVLKVLLESTGLVENIFEFENPTERTVG